MRLVSVSEVPVIVLSSVFRAKMESFKDLIVRTARSLKSERAIVWRTCDSRWERRVRNATSEAFLKRSFRFLLCQSGFRRIARNFNRGLYSADNVLPIVGEFIVDMRMEGLPILASLMVAYREELARQSLINELESAESYAASASVSAPSTESGDVSVGEPSPRRRRISVDSNASTLINVQLPQHAARRLSYHEEEDVEMEEGEVADEEEEVEVVEHQQHVPAPLPVIQREEVDDEASSDDENYIDIGVEGSRFERYERFKRAMKAHYPEPISAVKVLLGPTTSEDPREIALQNFYNQPSTSREISGYMEGNVFTQFDNYSVIDCCVNEYVRRLEAGNFEPLPFGDRILQHYLDNYANQVMNSPRAREVRWFHDLVENINSPLYTENDIFDLLSRIRESFSGRAEE